MSNRLEKLDQLIQLLGEIYQKDDSSNYLEGLEFLKFKDKIAGKGILWTGDGPTKQLIYNANPERLFSSENIDIAAGKSYKINSIDILNENELGPSVVKSNIKELGRLKGLIVDGSVSLGEHIFYDHTSDRLGVGTDQPTAALTVADQGVEIVLGAEDYNKASIGAFNSVDLQLVTDNTARITIGAGGNIELGNRNNGPIQVTIHGTLGVNVGTPDPRTGLHVSGPIKFNDKLHLSGTSTPDGGSFNQGDIVWNEEPQQGKFIGWVCIKAGNPGLWSGFGLIQ